MVGNPEIEPFLQALSFSTYGLPVTQALHARIAILRQQQHLLENEPVSDSTR